jgi:hypothetical protein
MLIDLPVFSGARPLVDPRLLDPSQAQVAADCSVRSGNIRPLRRMKVEARLAVLNIADVILYDGRWLPFFEPVSVCRSLVNADAQGRMYYTGRDSGAMMFRRAATGGADTPVRLGLPAPTAAPAVEVRGTGDAGADAFDAYWVWTWVSDLGEESAPSPASAICSCKAGQSFAVSGMVLPDLAGRNPAAKKRLYRSNSSATATAEQLVAEFDAALESFTDAVLSSALGETMPTEGWLPPPDGLQGLCTVRGGSLAGFTGNRVWFSEPHAPYAWPRKYAQSLEHDVVALAATGSYLVALTNAAAYVIPCDDITSTAPTRLEGHTPCLGARGVVSMRQGVLFPGVDGLYLVSAGTTAPENLSASVISEESWRALNPASFRAWPLGDRYVCFCEDAAGVRRGFLFDLAAPDMLISLGLHATCGWLEEEGRRLHLGFAAGGRTSIALWEGDAARYSAQWRSKVFRAPAPVSMAAARIEADFPAAMTEADFLARRQALVAGYAEEMAAGALGGVLGTSLCGATPFAGDILDEILTPYVEEPVVTFQLFVDGREACRRNVTGDRPFTLPVVTGQEFEVLVSGAVPVRRVSLATSMAEVRAAG